MAGDAKKLQPIIVKKVVKGGHGAHGGAWKIAYADFVTAMMAFFLLMWLLGSTSEGDKKGIADYFNSPLKVALAGGSGSGDSSHLIKGGGEDLSRSHGQVRRGDVQAPRSTINLMALRAEQRRAEMARLESVMQRVREQVAASAALQAYASQIRLEMTRDGLRIQIVDAERRPMFDSGSAVVQPAMRELLRIVGGLLAEVPNRVTLEGHTDSMPFASGAQGYTNWELSADRANASRRELVAGGLPAERLLRVEGLAASRPLDDAAPAAPANRRISILVLNREAEDRFFDRAPTPAGEAAADPAAETTIDTAVDAALPSIRPDLAGAAQHVGAGR
ncbi:MAG: flagellar motor protein MotB [Burkholderiales bacterium]|nr:flagellar motor protein MotB [Burkholderiales bacterium]